MIEGRGHTLDRVRRELGYDKSLTVRVERDQGPFSEGPTLNERLPLCGPSLEHRLQLEIKACFRNGAQDQREQVPATSMDRKAAGRQVFIITSEQLARWHREHTLAGSKRRHGALRFGPSVLIQWDFKVCPDVTINRRCSIDCSIELIQFLGLSVGVLANYNCVCSLSDHKPQETV